MESGEEQQEKTHNRCLQVFIANTSLLDYRTAVFLLFFFASSVRADMDRRRDGQPPLHRRRPRPEAQMRILAGKRKKRRFTPEARKGGAVGTSSSSSSSSSSSPPTSLTPAPKRRTVLVERRLEVDSSEDEYPGEEIRTVHRCPFVGCPDSSVASAGWLQRRALIAHVNTVHLSLPGVRLPEEFAQTVPLCPRCRLIVSSRGCPSCQAKGGRANAIPLIEMEVDAALTAKVSIMQHVPKGFRIEWCELLADEINHFCEPTTKCFTLRTSPFDGAK